MKKLSLLLLVSGGLMLTAVAAIYARPLAVWAHHAYEHPLTLSPLPNPPIPAFVENYLKFAHRKGDYNTTPTSYNWLSAGSDPAVATGVVVPQGQPVSLKLNLASTMGWLNAQNVAPDNVVASNSKVTSVSTAGAGELLNSTRKLDFGINAAPGSYRYAYTNFNYNPPVALTPGFHDIYISVKQKIIQAANKNNTGDAGSNYYRCVPAVATESFPATTSLEDFNPCPELERNFTITIYVAPAPKCTLKVSPDKINPGGSSSLSWSTSDAASIVLTPALTVNTPTTGGSVTVRPSATTTYTGTVYGPGGAVNCSAVVTVGAPAV